MLLQGALQARIFSLFRSPQAVHEDRSLSERLYRTPTGVRYQPALGLALVITISMLLAGIIMPAWKHPGAQARGLPDSSAVR
jgi:hypothetical protein